MPDTLKAVNDGVPGLGNRSLADDRRLQDMQAAWKAYLGETPDPLKIEPGQPNTNVKANRLAPIVDTGLFYLFGLALKLEVDAKSLLGHDLVDPDQPLSQPGDALGSLSGGGAASMASQVAMQAARAHVQEAQDYLNAAWGDEDDMMTLLAKLAMNGGVFGHTFAKILPPDAASGRPHPRVVVLDPQNVTVQTDPEDCDTAIAYTITFAVELPDGSVVTKRQIIARRDVFDDLTAASGTHPEQLPDLAYHQGSVGTDGVGTDGQGDPAGADAADLGADAAWVIATYARHGATGDWQQLTVEGWDHPWPPIADCQNLPISNQHWGMPDLTADLIGLNETLNFVLSNINKIGHSHGHPWIYATGTNASQITTAPGRIITLPGDNAKLNALVANGDIAGLMAYAADLRSSMDEQSKVPGVATGRISELPRGQMSGVTVRMLYMPLMFKSVFKQRLYGKLIRELSTRMLALGGYGDGTDHAGVRVSLHWQDPMPTDDLAEAQTGLTWKQVGVSTATVLSRAGFDPEAEATKVELEGERSAQLQSQGKAPLQPGMALPPPSGQQQQQQQQQPPTPPSAGTNADAETDDNADA